MAELKTKQNKKSVPQFLKSVENKKRVEDAKVIIEMMKDITGDKPKMWGDSVIGFGTYHYKYESGREGDWFVTGVSPRKANLTVYIMSGFGDNDPLLKKLGKYKTSKSCLYITKLENVDLKILRKLIEKSVEHMNTRTDGGVC
jgi:hypothetical protein